jgi:hypothetical protein
MAWQFAGNISRRIHLGSWQKIATEAEIMASIIARTSSLDSDDLGELDSIGKMVAEYEKMGRRRLQKVAKANGIQANLASADIIKYA